MRLSCDNCDKKISNGEEYYFHSNNQTGNGFTVIKSYFKENGKIYCADCMEKIIEYRKK